MAVRDGKFDMAVLLPNSFRAAALARIGGGIKRVVGYDRDGRGWMLSDKLSPRPNSRKLATESTENTEQIIGNSEETTREKSGENNNGNSFTTESTEGTEQITEQQRNSKKRKDTENSNRFTTENTEGTEQITEQQRNSKKRKDTENSNRFTTESTEQITEQQRNSKKRKDTENNKKEFPVMPAIEYYNAIAVHLGAADPGWRMELPVSEADQAAADELLAGAEARRPRVMLNPGAAFGPSKLWSAERFAAVADELVRRRGAAIIINAAPTEKDVARAVAAAMRESARGGLVNLAERANSLGLVKALLRRCDLLITNDTGARHLGAAMACAVVTIFGSTDLARTELHYDRERIVRADVPCSPCQKKICPNRDAELGRCMKAVTVEMVLAAAEELLVLEGGR